MCPQPAAACRAAKRARRSKAFADGIRFLRCLRHQSLFAKLWWNRLLRRSLLSDETSKQVRQVLQACAMIDIDIRQSNTRHVRVLCISRFLNDGKTAALLDGL